MSQKRKRNKDAKISSVLFWKMCYNSPIFNGFKILDFRFKTKRMKKRNLQKIVWIIISAMVVFSMIIWTVAPMF